MNSVYPRTNKFTWSPMKNFILVFAIFVMSFSSFAKDFQIEQDQVFKTILTEFEKPGKNLALYQESENYRFDLSLTDIKDRVTIVLDDMRFKKYEDDLNPILEKGDIYFYDWFQEVKKTSK